MTIGRHPIPIAKTMEEMVFSLSDGHFIVLMEFNICYPLERLQSMVSLFGEIPDRLRCEVECGGLSSCLFVCYDGSIDPLAALEYLSFIS